MAGKKAGKIAAHVWAIQAIFDLDELAEVVEGLKGKRKAEVLGRVRGLRSAVTEYFNIEAGRVAYSVGGPGALCDCGHESQDHKIKGRGKCRACDCPSYRD